MCRVGYEAPGLVTGLFLRSIYIYLRVLRFRAGQLFQCSAGY
jgi:hypothetical protein